MHGLHGTPPSVKSASPPVGRIRSRGKLATLPPTGYPAPVRKLVHRPRRLRRSPALRNLVRQTQLSAHDFVLPLFVSEKLEQRRPVASMPGVFQLSMK